MFEYDNKNSIISIEDACEQLQIGKSSLYHLPRSKKLTAFRIGRNWKIPASSISDYIQNQCKK